MNTTQLKKFAAEARTILKEGVINRLDALGFDHKGHVSEEDRPTKGQGFVLFRGDAMPDDGFFERWQSLYERVQQKGIQEVYEEAAYTWFNRLMAIRIMAKNGFIAPLLEYVSDSTRIPVILSQAREGQFPEMSAAEREQLMAIIDDGRKSQEQFAILITAYCHANPVINKCFGGVTDYTTLLLPQNIIAEGGFIDLLNNTPFIDDDDYKSAELIGWLYQFYISEKKDDVFASFKAGKKAEAEDIPAATQIFTPNWIVKYMVQNTLGRIYLDNNPYDTEIKEQMKYLVEPSEPTPEDAIFHYDSLEDLRLGDLACGSGHILNEFFDLMYLFYIEDGYSRRNAIENIFLKNLTGIDLDTRAKQLAQFALMVKACQKDNSFLDAAVMPNVLDMPTPLDMNFVKQTLPEFFLGGNAKMLQETEEAFELLQQAENLGSIMKFNISDSSRAAIEIRMKEWEAQPTETVSDGIKALLHSFKLILALTQKYSALVMNPPYMRSSNMNETLSNYVKENYDEGKTDLFSSFMILAINLLNPNGKYGMINMHAWMFLSSFKDLRHTIIKETNVDSLLHLGPRTFDELSGEVVQNSSFVITNKPPFSKGNYYRLIAGKDCEQKEQLFFSAKSKEKVFYPNIDQKEFVKLPNYTFGAYWFTDYMISLIQESASMKEKGFVSGGRNKTHNNVLYVRCIWEVSDRSHKWKPYSNGGNCRKWYGNNVECVNWSDTAQNFYQSHGGLLNSKFWNKKGITWNSGKVGFRVKDEEDIYSSSSPTVFNSKIGFDKYVLGLLNSEVSKFQIDIINPSLTLNPGDVLSLKYIDSQEKKGVEDIVDNCIDISQKDWNSHETSRDFQRNELLCMDTETMLENIDWYCDQVYKETGEQLCIDPAAPEPDKISWCYDTYTKKWERLHRQLQENEISLNEKFIETPAGRSIIHSRARWG
ncbi:BREX-1 system adenine-specific DNA-methyltransferase PglX [uncultured Prevotella sp.]|uniref:BREX-1 system adenine-specific DNA-methyltransferase PglX n=1 Tax=uncultured Prevotella sp. TaxID=159272 RepID=UPI0025905A65|nr:BREX-1 system adenine-specific DNA-methyltransferase PglX [uncultured Prevotella sp.]